MSVSLLDWHFDPLILAGLTVTGGLYGTGLGRLWRSAGRARGVSGRRALSFLAGMLVVLLASISPLHELAEHRFWGHMVQHLLLILVAAPLLVAGSPHIAWLWAFNRQSRHTIGRYWREANRLRAVLHWLTLPLAAWTIHAAIVWGWHLPAAYQLALRNPAVHQIEHLSFLSSAILFWWVLLQPAGSRRMNPGAGVIYLGTAGMQSGLLGALLTFAGSPLYATQFSGAGPQGLTPLEDQQLAGLMMWLPGGLVYLVAAAIGFVAWMQPGETRLSFAEVQGAIREG